MKAEVYILGLFTFQGEEDENIVFSNEQLNIINTNIENQLGIKRVSQPSKWVNYPLNKKELMECLHTSACTITAAEMGYYHHRVIFRFILEGENLHPELRNIRQNLKSYSKEIIQKAIIQPNRDLKFIDFDIYPLFIIHEGLNFFMKKEDPVFSNDTTTMAFDITEPSKLSPIGKKYNIRISIPSTIIYTRAGVSDDFLKAMINSIYQYCLYEKKELNKQKKITEIGEGQLVKLWHHIIDTMGGRTLDKNIAKVSQTNYILAFAALLIAIVAFDIEKFTANWHYLTGSVKTFANVIFSIFH
ncbi:hypothetical protein [Neobacillus sp. 114]|uniref:hypothetical protein n=1 Tax=Neobacillus sp. 114 TaxID=3048535 RepID=UPI0024C22F49|nr:hypothetical protein [Neobacillus sp. 114]